MPRISIAVPVHNMHKRDFFLSRLEKSLEEQTYQNFELVVTEKGKMAENTNAAIENSTGDVVKILYMDDYLASPKSLERMVNKWNGGWLVTGCNHDKDGVLLNEHIPTTQGLEQNANTIGSPSVLMFQNDDPILFDEKLSWMLDVDLYKQLLQRYGEPTIINEPLVTIGLHSGQMTNILTDEEKQLEVDYINAKYANHA